MTHPRSRAIKISCVSDLVCPWSYITTKQILTASSPANFPDRPPFTVELEHKPYLLHPTWADDESYSMKDHFIQSYGQERWQQMRDAMGRLSGDLGLNIQRDNGVVCSTLRAHRLLLLAWHKGGSQMQTSLLLALYHACLEQGENISDLAVLSALAQEVKLMSKEEAVEFLVSDELKGDVQRMVSCAQRHGVKGVPFIVIDGRWALSGGQSSEVFHEIFDQLAQGQEPVLDDKVKTGAIC